MIFDSKQMANKFLDGDLTSNSDIEQLITDSKTKQAYSRYQLISHMIKDEAVAPDVCIADSVMTALSQEATVLAPQAEQKPVIADDANVISFPARFGKQLGGMAIAASVALVALINFGGVNTNHNQTIQTLASTNTDTPVMSRAELQQAHQLFIDYSLNNQVALPVIQTVSNQKAVAITVVLNKASDEDSNTLQDNKKDN